MRIPAFDADFLLFVVGFVIDAPGASLVATRARGHEVVVLPLEPELRIVVDHAEGKEGAAARSGAVQEAFERNKDTRETITVTIAGQDAVVDDKGVRLGLDTAEDFID